MERFSVAEGGKEIRRDRRGMMEKLRQGNVFNKHNFFYLGSISQLYHSG